MSQVAEWSIADVKTAVLNHEAGDFYDSGLLVDYMDRNPRISGALDTRCKGVVGLPFSLEPADDSPEAEKYRDEVQEWWWEIFPESLLSGLMRSVVGMGYAPAEMTFHPLEKRWMPGLHPWHQSNWYRNTYSNKWECYQGKGALTVVEPGRGQWVLLEAASYRSWMRGIVRCLGLDSTSRELAVTDWLRWCEKHGMPIVKASVPTDQINTQAGKSFRSGMRTMGREGVVGIPTVGRDLAPWDAEYLEPKTVSWAGFRELINHCDRDVAIGILGQTLTTDVKGGSLAAAQVHELVRQDYIRADVEVLSTTLRKQVLFFYMLYNHGPESVKLTPWPKWDTRRPSQALDEAATIKAIGDAIEKIKTASPRVDVDALLEKFAIPLKDEDEVEEEPEQEPEKPAPEDGEDDGEGDDGASETEEDEATKE